MNKNQFKRYIFTIFQSHNRVIIDSTVRIIYCKTDKKIFEMGASVTVPVNEEHRKILEAERAKATAASGKNDSIHGYDDSKVKIDELQQCKSEQ